MASPRSGGVDAGLRGPHRLRRLTSSARSASDSVISTIRLQPAPSQPARHAQYTSRSPNSPCSHAEHGRSALVERDGLDHLDRGALGA